MFAKDRRKQNLQQLREQLGELNTALPREARGLRRAITATDADIAQRLKPSLRRVKTAELERFEQRITELTTVAQALPSLIRELTSAIEAERALTAKTAGGGDRELADWQARRGRDREARMAATADQVADIRGLDAASQTLRDLTLQTKRDGAALSLFGEARERVRALGGVGDDKALADAMPGLKQALISDGPHQDWAQRLLALVKPLRGLQPRQRPPQLEQVFERLERLSDWIEVLRDETAAAIHPGENRLRRLSTRYHELTANEGWRAVDQTVVDALLAETTTLEDELVAQAETERGALTDELARNAEMFEQLADPELSPGLGEVLRKLLLEPPDGPDAFGSWRSRCRRANERFREAIGADSGRIELMCENLAKELQAWTDNLAKLPLDQSDGAEHSRIERDLKAQRALIGADVPVPNLLTALARLGKLREDGERLSRRANAKASRLSRHRQAVRARALRLLRLTALVAQLDEHLDATLTDGLTALTEPAPEPPDLQRGQQELERSRHLIGTLEHGLLQAARQQGLKQLAKLSAINDLLEQTQRPVDIRLNAGWGEGERLSLREIERLVIELPTMESRLHEALQRQTEELMERRERLVAEAAGIDRDLLSGVDGATLDRAVSRLRDCDPSRFTDPIELVRTLRMRLRLVERQLRRIIDERQTITQTTRRLQDRLERLQHDHFELDDRSHIDRIWALIQPVAGVIQAHGERRAQLEHAEQRLSALERHAQRIAATRFAAHYQRLREREDPAARALVDAIGDDPFRFPDHDLRLQARDLAMRDPARGEPQ